MTLTSMEQLVLQIKKPYKDVYSLNSKRVKCLGMIKDPVVNFDHITMKRMVMYIVVEHIPTRFGMLLSISWGMRLRAFIKLDLTYATIPVFGGEEHNLYSESRFIKNFTKANNSNNSLVYGQEKDLSCFLLEMDDQFMEETQVEIPSLAN